MHKATVHSLYERIYKDQIRGSNKKPTLQKLVQGKNDSEIYANLLTKWNKMTKDSVRQCERVGTQHCMRVHNEILVLRPEREIRKVFAFLGVDWEESVLNNQNFIGTKVMYAFF